MAATVCGREWGGYLVVEFELYLSLCKYHIDVVTVLSRQVSRPHVFDEFVLSHVWERRLDIQK